MILWSPLLHDYCFLLHAPFLCQKSLLLAPGILFSCSLLLFHFWPCSLLLSVSEGMLLAPGLPLTAVQLFMFYSNIGIGLLLGEPGLIANVKLNFLKCNLKKNADPAIYKIIICPCRANRWPSDLQSDTLPPEPSPPIENCSVQYDSSSRNHFHLFKRCARVS